MHQILTKQETSKVHADRIYNVQELSTVDLEEKSLYFNYSFELPQGSSRTDVSDLFKTLYSEWFLTELSGAVALDSLITSTTSSGSSLPTEFNSGNNSALSNPQVQALIADLQNSVVYNIVREYFRELFKNSYDALNPDTSVLEIELRLTKCDDGYQAVWRDNGKGWDKLEDQTVLHTTLFPENRSGSQKDLFAGDLGGAGLGMKKMGSDFTKYDEEAIITWRNNSGIEITFSSKKTVSAVNCKIIESLNGIKSAEAETTEKGFQFTATPSKALWKATQEKEREKREDRIKKALNLGEETSSSCSPQKRPSPTEDAPPQEPKGRKLSRGGE